MKNKTEIKNSASLNLAQKFVQGLILIISLLIFLFLEVGIISQIGSDNVFLAQMFSIKSLKVLSPNGGEEWKTGETNTIKWTSRGIDRVGIVIFDGQEPKWIAKNVDAKEGKYDWNIFIWEEPSENYRIAVFEFSWKKGNKIDYSDNAFTVVGPKYVSCDSLSVGAEWPYLASDFPNLRKVFVTNNRWTGNLGGLAGADEKCQKEAEKLELPGTWKAFLGDDRTLAIERLKLDGVFVEAERAATLSGGKTCHRLLGENFEKFFEKFFSLNVMNQKQLSEDFFKGFSNLWLGRVKDASPKDCVVISSQYPSKVMAENYSFTSTCENWTVDNDEIPGYPPVKRPYTPEYPKCYLSSGKTTNAVAQGGLSAGLNTNNTFSPYLGKYCSTWQRLLCVEQ